MYVVALYVCTLYVVAAEKQIYLLKHILTIHVTYPGEGTRYGSLVQFGCCEHRYKCVRRTG